MQPELASSLWTNIGCFLFLLLSVLDVEMTEAVIKLPDNIKVPAVLAFGDSIVDSGNNNYLPTIFKCNFSPYGKDFMGGKPTGRFSNGKIPTDFLVETLGIKEGLPAYLDPNLKPGDLLTGVSFASGASGYDPLTAKLQGVLNLRVQLDMFRTYTQKLKAIVGEERTKNITKDAVYIVVAGSNDIALNYFGAPFRRVEYDVAAYTDLMVQEALSFIQELYNMGARRIGVFSAPPIGCIPAAKTVGGGKQRQCAEKYNEAASLFNSKLSSSLDKLNTNFQNAKAVYVDIYSPLLDLILNHASFGFEEVDKGCCGTGKIEVGIFCNLGSITCPDPSKFFFWDSFHPTEEGYQTLVNIVFGQHLKDIVCIGIPC